MAAPGLVALANARPVARGASSLTAVANASPVASSGAVRAVAAVAPSLSACASCTGGGGGCAGCGASTTASRGVVNSRDSAARNALRAMKAVVR
jgi:hypothetical protein